MRPLDRHRPDRSEQRPRAGAADASQGLRRARWLSALLLATSLLHLAPRARADQAGELDKGKQLYVESKYEDADKFLRQAIDGAAPTISDPALVPKGRMYLAASDFYLGRKQAAIDQFEKILDGDPKFEPDPIAFPAGVIEEFKKTRARLAQELADKSKTDLIAKELAGSKAELAKLAARYDALKAYSSEERVVTKHSRVIATLPLGVGQFQNGDTALGIFFAATEGVALVSAAISYGIHESIPRENVADPEKARSVEVSSRLVNLISVGSFIALAVGGVVQANVAFVSESYDTRVRPLPSTLARVVPLLAPNAGGATIGFSLAF